MSLSEIQRIKEEKHILPVLQQIKDTLSLSQSDDDSLSTLDPIIRSLRSFYTTYPNECMKTFLTVANRRLSNIESFIQRTHTQ